MQKNEVKHEKKQQKAMPLAVTMTGQDACDMPGLRWQSESGLPAPKRFMVADDGMSADRAFRLASEGVGLLWRGDFQNARQLLQAMTRRMEHRSARKPRKTQVALSPCDAFHLYRQSRAQRARTLGMLLIEVDAEYGVHLRRAPDIRQACHEAYGAAHDGFVVSLREILGLIGASEWRRKGVWIAPLGASIHPWHGVFSPLRGEYLALLAKAPLPACEWAFDIGTGTGVIAALLAHRGVQKMVATDCDPRALSCARDNLQRLGLAQRVTLLEADLFPPGKAPLVVCNPPWIPARPNAPIERAIYDPDSTMLRRFLAGLKAHLTEGGQGWLILSDLAERLGLREEGQWQQWADAAGLKIAGRMDTRPTHARAIDPNDPLHTARSQEITTLWQLVVK